MAGTSYLADTNILLRLSKSNDPEFTLVRGAVRALKARGERLCYVPQNIVEFWNACTRPADRNGYGLSPPEADQRATRIERAFTLLPDNENIYPEWRRVVVACSVSGAQVHDARIVPAMRVHGVSRLLTLNERDFVRYPSLTIVHPRDVR
ncbi:MAG: type II toxin-antitoxin system VapC family toxin [Candidatus Korobacteraceae bacterium]